MNCTNQITHTIVAGDTLWSLAIRYNTTVEKLLELNPGVEVYNLLIGSELVVCEGVVEPPVTPPIECIPPTEHFRRMLEVQMCWIADQYGSDEARRIIGYVYDAWQNNRIPC